MACMGIQSPSRGNKGVPAELAAWDWMSESKQDEKGIYIEKRLPVDRRDWLPEKIDQICTLKIMATRFSTVRDGNCDMEKEKTKMFGIGISGFSVNSWF